MTLIRPRSSSRNARLRAKPGAGELAGRSGVARYRPRPGDARVLRRGLRGVALRERVRTARGGVLSAGGVRGAQSSGCSSRARTLVQPLRATPFERFFFREPVNGYVFEVIDGDRGAGLEAPCEPLRPVEGQRHFAGVHDAVQRRCRRST